MRYRKLGKNGPDVSEVGYGAWAIGGGMWGGQRDDDSRAALERAFERGVNFIDTALVYGDGHSERLVGEFARAHAGKVYVATKVPPKSYQWPAPRGRAAARTYFPASWIIECAEKSLRNLGLERIDLLQLHVWADGWTDDDEWCEALEQAARRRARSALIGISINSHDPKSALRVVRAGAVDALQVFYNLFDQSPEDELFPACLEHGVGVLARVPFDEGSLTGKLRDDTTFPDGDFRAQYFGGGLLQGDGASGRSAAADRRRRRRVDGARRAPLHPVAAGGLDGDSGHAHAAPGRREQRRQRRRPAAARCRRPAARPSLGSPAPLKSTGCETRAGSARWGEARRAPPVEGGRESPPPERLQSYFPSDRRNCHSLRCTTGSCSARSRSRSRLPTCSDSGACTHL